MPKQEVEIQEKAKTPQQQLLEEMLARLEKPVEPPPIEDTLGKVEAAIAQAQKAKHKPVKQTWYCTDCGGAHIQIDDNGTHYPVDALDGEFVHPGTGNPLTGAALAAMTNYAIPKVERGDADRAQSKNAATLSKMKALKGVK